MAEKLASLRKSGTKSKSFAIESLTSTHIVCGFEPKHIYMVGRYQGTRIYANFVDLPNNSAIQYWDTTTYTYPVSNFVQSYDGNSVTLASINSEWLMVSIIG